MSSFHPACISQEVIRLHNRFLRANRIMDTPGTPVSVIRRETKREQWCLRLMNSHLLGSGFDAGQHVEVEGHIYRCVSNGQRAVYIGQCLPDDAPWEAMASLDAALTREDETREWASYYNAAVSVN